MLAHFLFRVLEGRGVGVVDHEAEIVARVGIAGRSSAAHLREDFGGIAFWKRGRFAEQRFPAGREPIGCGARRPSC